MSLRSINRITIIMINSLHTLDYPTGDRTRRKFTEKPQLITCLPKPLNAGQDDSISTYSLPHNCEKEASCSATPIHLNKTSTDSLWSSQAKPIDLHTFLIGTCQNWKGSQVYLRRLSRGQDWIPFTRNCEFRWIPERCVLLPSWVAIY